ncbi:MAG TPA: EsaB/YukD family protein [Ktedonosporobacter sp.]|nr:EsaB/YukD family protein [Ktedonosporobacter sp.]
MHKFEILIEENAFGQVRPVEVVADAPVVTVIPTLVEALHLPQTDLFGKKLVYMLRQSSGGRILSDHMTLLASGVQAGERLALDSFVLDGSVETVMRSSGQWSEDEYASPTIADSDLFAALQSRQTSGLLPGKQGILTRRALLVAGGSVLAAGGLAVGYAAYHAYLAGAFASLFATTAPLRPALTPQPTASVVAKPQLTFTQHQDTVRALAWSSDGQMLASGDDDRQLLIWRRDGTVLHTFQQPSAVRALAWSPDGQRLVTASGTRVTFFDVLAGTEITHFSHRHTQTVTSLAWAAHGPMGVVSGGSDRRAIVWDGVNYRPATTFTLHSTPIEAVCWSADGQSVASASQGGVVRVWDGASGQELHSPYQDARVPMRAIAFTLAGGQDMLAVGGDDGIVRLWHGLTCQTQQNDGALCVDMPQQLHISQHVIRTLAWSPDGNWLAVGGDEGVVTIWKPGQSQKPMFTIPQQAIVHSVTWSADGKQLGVAAGNTVTIWSLG